MTFAKFMQVVSVRRKDLLDLTRFRVSLLCSCSADLAYGYGPTIAAARINAMAAFRKHHGHGRMWTEEIVEEAVSTKDGGSHYEEVRP